LPPIEATRAGARLQLHVQPRASRTEVVGLHGDAIKVRVAAPPVDGAANDELVRYLSRRLGIARETVVITAGEAGRRKVVEVAGLTPAEVAARLDLPA